MSRGFQPDEANELHHQEVLTELVERWQDAETAALDHARTAIAAGARARIIAETLGMSKPTMYRWMRNAHKS